MPSSPELRRVPRLTKLMALAIRLDQQIRDGQVTDPAELARLGYVTRARPTHIMNLLLLAPHIQEEILFQEANTQGRDLVTVECSPKADPCAMRVYSPQRRARRLSDEKAT